MDTSNLSMIALIPTEEDAERLHIENGLEQDDLHVTLFFLGSDDDLPENGLRISSEVSSGTADMFKYGHIPGQVSGIGYLGNEDPPATVLFLNGETMSIMQSYVSASLQASGDFKQQYRPWIPHLTLGYGIDVNSVSLDRDQPIWFDRIRFAYGTHDFDYSFVEVDKVWNGSFLKIG